MRTIGVVTVARSDYGIYLPLLSRIQAEPDLRLMLFVSGTHLAAGFGMTVRAIEQDGWPIAERVPIPLASDTPDEIARAIGAGVTGFADAFTRSRPDLLVVLGDRFDMYAAALASVPFNLPLAHIHGGELTQGAMDDALRHSLTKLSHLHCVATEEYARRVAQLGEEPWRITISGAPALDNLNAMSLWSRPVLETQLGIHLPSRFLLCTFHPVTREFQETERYIDELLAALQAAGIPVVFSMPNADTANGIIRKSIGEYVRSHAAVAIENAGTRGYFSLMRLTAAMVGNSSSGLIEAPSFELPVVNIGTRQTGRVRAANVIDVDCERGEILAGLQRALLPGFRQGLSGLKNPYGDGHAAERIVKRLKTVELNDHLIRKAFCDVENVR